LHALRRGVPQPLAFHADHQHAAAYAAAAQARRTVATGAAGGDRSGVGASYPQPRGAAAFLASVQSPELMERRRRERQRRRASRDKARQATAAANDGISNDSDAKENATNGAGTYAGSEAGAAAAAAPRKKGFARWFSLSSGAQANSTAKSRAASGRAVSEAVAWEMEKAHLLRDLTPREKALVLTFSDRANFRAAVAALVRMRQSAAGSSAHPPALGSPTRLRASGMRV
jgi:hypothetical protein